MIEEDVVICRAPVSRVPMIQSQQSINAEDEPVVRRKTRKILVESEEEEVIQPNR